LTNINDMFHVSQVKEYVIDLKYILESDFVQVKDNLFFEIKPFKYNRFSSEMILWQEN